MKSSSSTPPATLPAIDPARADTLAGDVGSGATLAAPGESALSGMIIQGRYRLETPLARGGMSVLYRATQLLLGRTVAVKIMTTPTAVANDAELEERFLREARAAAQLRHPNTIVVHDYGRTDDGHYFIAMEYLEGRDLAQAIAEDGPFEPARARHIALQVCESLIEAHALGIVHRDVKPLNVFLRQVGDQPDHVKVLDFGLAKLLGDAGAMQTRAGMIMGTPAYMSPEQVLGGVIDARSDIYSFGALLFHMLAGDAPFGIKGDYAIMDAQVKKPAPSLRSIHRSCRASAQLEAVIQRCLAKDPAARYGSMREVAEALQACPPERSTSRRVRVAGIAAAACALGAALLGMFGLPGDSDAPHGKGAQPVATITTATPARPSTASPASTAVVAPAQPVAAVDPATVADAADPATAAETADPATAAETADPATAAAAAAEQPAETAAAPRPVATPETAASPARVQGTARRPMSRRAISRRQATQPRRTRPDTQKPPPDEPAPPAVAPPDEDRAGAAVRRNPDPWAE